MVGDGGIAWCVCWRAVLLGGTLLQARSRCTYASTQHAAVSVGVEHAATLPFTATPERQHSLPVTGQPKPIGTTCEEAFAGLHSPLALNLPFLHRALISTCIPRGCAAALCALGGAAGGALGNAVSSRDPLAPSVPRLQSSQPATPQ